jgi:hypothetical protein
MSENLRLVTSLPIIINKHTSTLDIVRDTKQFIVDAKKYHTIIKPEISHLPNLQQRISYYLPNLESFNTHRIKYSLNSTKNYMNTEPDYVLTESTTVSNYSTKLRSLFSKSQDSLHNYFSNVFYEFLGVDDEFEDKYFTKNKFEDHCLKNIVILKSRISDSALFIKNYKRGNNEIELKLKSFKLVFESQDVKNKVYLPFDFITIFGFCTTEQIIFILSQCIDLNETKVELKLDEAKIANMVMMLPYFNTDSRTDFSNKFKMNRNLQFDWISANKPYKATLYCPKVSFNFVYKRLKLNKYLSRELFLEIYPNEFMNWDKRVLNYLTLDKEFRNVFIKILTNRQGYTGNITINIDKRFKPIELPSLESTTIQLVYQTDKGTYLVSVRGFRIELDNHANSYNMTWKNTLTLLKLKDFINIQNFVSRKTNITKEGKINFNKNFMDNIDNELIEFFNIFKTIEKPNNQFNLIQPSISCQILVHGRYNKHKLELPFDFSDELGAYTDINTIIHYFCKQLSIIISLIHMENSKSYNNVERLTTFESQVKVVPKKKLSSIMDKRKIKV